MAHGGEHFAAHIAAGGLQAEPFVYDQWFVLEECVKALQGWFCQRAVACYQGLQCAQAVGHVAGVFEALVGFARPDYVARGVRGAAQVG